MSGWIFGSHGTLVLIWLFAGLLAAPYVRVVPPAWTRLIDTVADRVQGVAACCIDACQAATAYLKRSFLAVIGFRRPLPDAAGDAAKPNLPPGLLGSIALGLLAPSIVCHFALLHDTLPDILNIAPIDRAYPHLGYFLGSYAPAVIVITELFAGVLMVSQGRQGTALFIGALAFELAICLARAVTLAIEVDDAGAIAISTIGLSVGIALTALACFLASVIYVVSKFLSPVLSEFQLAKFLASAGRFALVGARNAALFAAAAALAMAIGLLWVVVVPYLALWLVISGALRFVLLPASLMIAFVLFAVPAFIVHRLEDLARQAFSNRVTATAVGVSIIVIVVTTLANAAERDAAQELDKYRVVRIDELRDAASEPDLLNVSPLNIRKSLLAAHFVVRVAAIEAVLCVPDITRSISERDRLRLVESCASIVGRLPSNVAGLVMPISESARSSQLPLIWRQPLIVERECVVDPPLSAMEGLSSISAKEVAGARRTLDAEAASCNALLHQRRLSSDAAATSAAQAFTAEVVARLGSLTFERSDVLGTLARIPETKAKLEFLLQVPIIRIRAHVLSDLIHDATVCRFTDHPSIVRATCEGDALNLAATALQAPDTDITFYRIVPPNAEQRLAADRWWTVLSAIAPRARSFTWSPEDAEMLIALGDRW